MRPMLSFLLPGVLAVAAAAAAAQCPPAWDTGFWTDDQLGTVRACIVFDDGTGPAVYIGKNGDGGDGLPGSVLKWDGHAWSATGAGAPNYASALAVFDEDGPGPGPARLFAAGGFGLPGVDAEPGVGRWNGAAWERVPGEFVGPGSQLASINCLLVHDDDGPGPNPPALYVGGSFVTIDGLPASNLARWDGQAWSAVGGSPLAGNQGVFAMTRWDADGPGPGPAVLVVGGNFVVGGTPAQHLARWDGAAWSQVGDANPGAAVHALAAWSENNASGAETLYAAGAFTSIGTLSASRVARFAGSWSALGSGLTGSMFSTYAKVLLPFDPDGPGPLPSTLVVGGEFDRAGGLASAQVAVWTGSVWVATGGVHNLNSPHAVNAAAPVDEDGDGPQPSRVLLGGHFVDVAGAWAPHLAYWDGVQLSRFGATLGADWAVDAIGEFDPDGDGPEPPDLVIGGEFGSVAGVAARGVAVRRRGAWQGLGSGLFTRVGAMASYDDDGPGPRPRSLFLGGRYVSGTSPIGRWDGAAISPVGAPLSSSGPTPILGMLVWDDDGPGPRGEALYVLGSITGGPLIRWDGASWQSIPAPPGGVLRGMVLFDHDGAGPAMESLHLFTETSAARWDGEVWTALPAPPALLGLPVVFDHDGDGPAAAAIYFGSQSTTFGGGPVEGLVRWDGQGWSAVLPGLRRAETFLAPATAWRMAVHDDDGEGPIRPALYVAGMFELAGGVPAQSVARWDGAAWSALGSGLSNRNGLFGRAVFSHDEDGDGPAPAELYLGGGFVSVGGVRSGNIARWGVHPGFRITGHPVPADRDAGEPASFSAAAEAGGPVTYRWRRDGIELVDGAGIGGAGTPTLTLSAVRLADAGVYDVVVTGPCGAAASGPAALAVRCRADFDGDGSVNSGDISYFLNRWVISVVVGNPISDFNEDGVINSGDISAFLTAWLDGIQAC